MTFPLEELPEFVEETRQSIAALAEGHNDLKETLEAVIDIQTLLLKTAATMQDTAKLLQTTIERQVNE